MRCRRPRQRQHHGRVDAFDLGHVPRFVDQRDDLGVVASHFLGRKDGEHVFGIAVAQGDDVLGVFSTGQFQGRRRRRVTFNDIGLFRQVMLAAGRAYHRDVFAAIGQTNIKRLMAYSSISHVGYALVGLAAGTADGVRGVVLYMAIYLAMNVGTFASEQKQFLDYQITNQDLINRGLVLVNGVRIALNLQLVE